MGWGGIRGARWCTSRAHVARVLVSWRVARHVSAATYATRPGICMGCIHAWLVCGRCGTTYARNAPQGTTGGKEGVGLRGLMGVRGGEVGCVVEGG